MDLNKLKRTVRVKVLRATRFFKPWEYSSLENRIVLLQREVRTIHDNNNSLCNWINMKSMSEAIRDTLEKIEGKIDKRTKREDIDVLTTQIREAKVLLNTVGSTFLDINYSLQQVVLHNKKKQEQQIKDGLI